MRLILACLLVLACIFQVRAHDNYPMECCGGQDCAPVDKVEMLAGSYATGALSLSPVPVMLVTSKHGTVVVPANFPRRESKDGRIHVCMRPAEAGTMKVLCVFFPPAM